MEWRNLVSSRSMDRPQILPKGCCHYVGIATQLVRYGCEHLWKAVRSVHAADTEGKEFGGERSGGGGGYVDSRALLGYRCTGLSCLPRRGDVPWRAGSIKTCKRFLWFGGRPKPSDGLAGAGRCEHLERTRSERK